MHRPARRDALFLTAWRICLLAVWISVSGCGRSERELSDPYTPVPAPAKTKARDPASSDFRFAGPPITDDEITRFAKSLERAAAELDEKVVAKHFDGERFAELLGDNPFPFAEETQREGLRKLSGQMGSHHFSQMIVRVASKGSVRFLRTMDVGDDRRPLFRLSGDDETFTYMALHIGRRWERLYAFDLDSYSSGESLSETVRRMAPLSDSLILTSVLSEDDRPVFEMFENEKLISEVLRLKDAARAQAALDAIDKLPVGMRDDKCMVISRVHLSGMVSEDAFHAAILEMENDFPGDPCLALFQIPDFILRKDLKRAHETIDQLDLAIGGDPYLQVWHAYAYRAGGELDRAIAAAQRAIDAEPDMTRAYDLLLDISLEQKDFKRTAVLLTLSRDVLNREIVDLTEVETYKEFVQSPEYAEWIKSTTERE